MNVSTEQLLRMLGRELLVRRKAVLAIFLLVNLASVAVGLSWSKSYMSSTTIFVEEKNILDPLMQGAAVRTPVTDRSRIAKEVIFGRKVMNQLAESLGMFSDSQSDIEKERVIDRLRSHTTITQAGRGLIRIEHSDADAKQAFLATQLLAELFISESHERKLEESKAAYEFIDKQVKEYHDKLQVAEEALKGLRIANIETGVAGGETNIVNRMNQLMVRIDQTSEQLRDAEIKKTSLERQLSGEVESTVVVTRAGQMRARISELQSQLATLRMTFHDAHPDVVRIRHQIDDLHEAVRAEEARRQDGARGSADSRASAATEEGVVHNPLYQQLRLDLAQTKTLIDTLNARIAEYNRQLQNERGRGKAVHSGDASLAEVSRDYQVNNTLYQDLLRRREQALVSMNINKERQGLGFSIQEEAELPLRPRGLELKYVILVGAILSVLMPAGLLFALVKFDPRIRAPSVIADQLKVPVLAVVPHLWSPPEIEHFNQEMRGSVVLIVGTVSLIAIFLILRITKVL
jgi:polysaccharide chain length determinant protein (PEP-CTERM system associated)